MALHRCPPVRPLRGQLLTRLRCRHRVAVARLAHHVRTSAIHHCISFLPTRYSLSVLHLLSRYLPEIGPSDRPPRSLGSFAAANTDIAWNTRSEERRVGKECVSTGRSRWSPEH